MPNTSTPVLLPLDYHTKQFFDPSEWEGEVEATFYLDVPGLRGRKFEGRIARFCSGDYAIVMRAIGGEGEVLLKRTPYTLWPEEADLELRPAHWAEWLGLIQKPQPGGCPLPILPNLSANQGLSRLHFDVRSGFGAQIISQGHGYLFDVRDDVENSEKRHHPHFDMADFVGDEGMRRLGLMEGCEFHAAMEAMFRDESGSLFQVLRFYSLSDDERAKEVFGCSYHALKITLRALKLVLTMSMGPGGEFANCKRAHFHPWHHNPEEVIALNRSECWWEDIAAPPRLAQLMERVCAVTGCQLRLERGGQGGEENGIVDARSVAQEWADQFHVRGECATGHMAVEARVELRELLGRGDRGLWSV